MFARFTALCLSSAAFLVLFALPSLNASSLFGSIRIYRSGVPQEASIAVGDVNGDGKLDLVTAGVESQEYGGTEISVLKATSDRKFVYAGMYYSGGSFPHSISLADVNGDGKLDVLVANDESIGVLLGNGNGQFQELQTFGSGANGMAVVDINSDGKLDLLLATHRTAEVRLGNGDGTFQQAQNYAFWGYAITAADINGDGKLDMLMAGAGIYVLLGNGDGTFQSAEVYPSGGNWANSLGVADVNGDGKPDILVANRVSGNVGVLLGNGDGTFQPVQTYDSGGNEAVMLVVEDFNGDGKPDLAVANIYGKTGGDSMVGVLLGNGDGTFQVAQPFISTEGWGGSIAVGNLTGSHMPDLVVSRCRARGWCAEGLLAILTNNTKGFVTTNTLSSSLNPSTYGQAVTFTATVTSAGPSTPTGTVRFMNGTTGLGYATLVEGVARLRKTNLPAGTLSLTARYNGDPDSAKSVSAPLTEAVSQATTETAITSSINPSTQGQAVMLTARVTSSPTAHISGTVTFMAGSNILGAAAVVGGKAGFITSTLPKGTNQITAVYGGTANIMGSSASLSQTVN